MLNRLRVLQHLSRTSGNGLGTRQVMHAVVLFLNSPILSILPEDAFKVYNSTLCKNRVPRLLNRGLRRASFDLRLPQLFTSLKTSPSSFNFFLQALEHSAPSIVAYGYPLTSRSLTFYNLRYVFELAADIHCRAMLIRLGTPLMTLLLTLHLLMYTHVPAGKISIVGDAHHHVGA
jgi:hypothetical protein